jgi:hypothetical protein
LSTTSFVHRANYVRRYARAGETDQYVAVSSEVFNLPGEGFVEPCIIGPGRKAADIVG